AAERLRDLNPLFSTPTRPREQADSRTSAHPLVAPEIGARRRLEPENQEEDARQEEKAVGESEADEGQVVDPGPGIAGQEERQREQGGHQSAVADGDR